MLGLALRRVALTLAAVLMGAWGAAALWFDGPAWRPLATVLAAAFPVAMIWLASRASRQGPVLAGVLSALLVLWWLSIPPSNDRDWQPDVARPATATFDGDLVTIENVRNFRYRSETDYTPVWETRTYDLRDVVGLDLFLSNWGSPYIAHTIMSWEFRDAPPLAISIEVRKERGETYAPVRSFFRTFELYYVVADERDVVRLRTSFRGEAVRLYRLAVAPDLARRLLVSYLEAVDRLAHRPRWYNALTHNCTTGIRLHVLEIGVAQPWDWRILVNERIDEMMYERGTIATDRPFPEIRAASAVSERGRAAGDAENFSARIRIGLPARPAPRTR